MPTVTFVVALRRLHIGHRSGLTALAPTVAGTFCRLDDLAAEFASDDPGVDAASAFFCFGDDLIEEASRILTASNVPVPSALISRVRGLFFFLLITFPNKMHASLPYV
jgi:hypothetical protein